MRFPLVCVEIHLRFIRSSTIRHITFVIYSFVFVLNMQLHRIFSGTGVSENINGTTIADPGQGSANQRWGRQFIILAIFFRKLHAIEKKIGPRGSAHP